MKNIFTILTFLFIFSNSYGQTEINSLLLGSLPINNGWDMVEYQNYIYISDGIGIKIVDVRNSVEPVLIDSIQTKGNSRSLFIDKNYLYLADATNGVNIYDLALPNRPNLIYNYSVDGETYDVFVNNNLLYITEWISNNWTSSRVLILDISDIENLLFVHSYNKPSGMMLTKFGGNEKLLCIADLYSISIFEYSKSDTLSFIYKIDLGYAISKIQLVGNYLFVANTGNGLRIIDLSIPSSPIEIAYYKAFRSNNGIFADGMYAYMAVNYLYPIILDISDITKPLQVGMNEKVRLSYNNDQYNFTAVLARNDIFYILDVTRGFYVVKNTHDPTSSINEERTIPDRIKLHQSYPNPFNPSTTISYSIPEQGAVQLKVFDVLGREVATLVNKEQSAGSYEVEFNPSADGKSLSSGVYFYTLRAGNFFETKKMVLLR